MTIQVTGKNLNIGDALRTHAVEAVQRALDKYIGRSFPGHVRIEKNRNSFETNCTVDLWNGFSLNAHGHSVDPHSSVEEAVEKLEKRLRRYKRRLKNHHNNQKRDFNEVFATDYLINPSETEESSGQEDTPLIVAETKAKIRELSVSDAVMQLDLANEAVLMFKNSSHGHINLIYRREDGNIGWIDMNQAVDAASKSN